MKELLENLGIVRDDCGGMQTPGPTSSTSEARAWTRPGNPTAVVGPATLAGWPREPLMNRADRPASRRSPFVGSH